MKHREVYSMTNEKLGEIVLKKPFYFFENGYRWYNVILTGIQQWFSVEIISKNNANPCAINLFLTNGLKILILVSIVYTK